MPTLDYLNFDIAFDHTDDGYVVRVVNSPAGQTSEPFSIPFDEKDLEIFLLRMGHRRATTRRVDSPEIEAAKQFGGKLYDALFDDEVRGCLRSSLDEARRQNKGLRLRLRFSEAPELADLPWEFLYNASVNRFLTLSQQTPLVRYIDLPRQERLLRVEAPLRILTMIADPSDYDRLDVEQEWQRLQEAVRDLIDQGIVEVERLDRATLLNLQRALRRGAYHIFHFIGHGDFDPRTDQGYLVLENDQGRGQLVSGQDLGTILFDHSSLRLAVLNACEGARASFNDPFAGVAQSLVQQGLSAVIAMQFEITDTAAALFAHEFYLALADGYPVDAALAEARRAIFATNMGTEWGVPVLFMRSPDGHLFDVQMVKSRSPRHRRERGYVEERQLQAAMPQTATVNVPTEVRVYVALQNSQGLRAHLPSWTEAGDVITKQDVTQHEVPVEFPIDPANRQPGPTKLYMRVSSADFDVPEGEKTLYVRPRADAGPLTFELVPRRAQRRARVLVELFRDEARTEGISSLTLFTEVRTRWSAAATTTWSFFTRSMRFVVGAGDTATPTVTLARERAQSMASSRDVPLPHADEYVGLDEKQPATLGAPARNAGRVVAFTVLSAFLLVALLAVFLRNAWPFGAVELSGPAVATPPPIQGVTPSPAATTAVPSDGEGAILHLSFDGAESLADAPIRIMPNTPLDPDQFVETERGGGIRFREGTVLALENETVDGRPIVNPARGEIEFWYRPGYGALENTDNHIFVLAGRADAAPAIFFGKGEFLIFGMRDSRWNGWTTAVSAQTPLWESDEWVHLRATWDVNASEPFQIYLNDERLPVRSRFHAATNGATSLEPFTYSDLRGIFIGAEDIHGDASADGIIDELVIRSRGREATVAQP